MATAELISGVGKQWPKRIPLAGAGQFAAIQFAKMEG